MRHLIAMLIAGAAALFAHHATAADNRMTIAVFTKNSTNPAYEAFRIAADQIARTAGAKVVHFVPKQPDNVDEQKAMVEQVIKDKPDAIIFIPVDDVAMIPSVKLLNEARIPVILVSNPLPGSFVTYVGADDFEIGYREARYLFEHLGGKGKIVVIEGTPAAPTNRERLRGYQRAFGEFPGIEVLGSAVGNYQTPDAKRGMEKLLTEHKQIDAVLSANDSMALGVLDALKAANRTAIVIGINGILPAVKQIEAGGMLASVDFNMFKIGCTATRAAVRHLKREPLPEKVMLPAEVIDKTNYKAWLVPVDQRTCPEWSEVAR
ncbi:sugar ABC transporter substrate-binding protein [Bradyrhizobium sp. AUGA SZCCT0431]|uniref:sugar ABC transporter substrate-binding protein n=1 Tax=Bradyrhizobium sp. AUGA SZCCT0431 TaxID=2807674 RepID=UPI001BA88260|nr:sugar ABC transporter substrate-binding protein [Bradyrhizobium sp. AUGA SZCCT0431]MBR1146245.1 sugar ABC transporter substrate-binding protein [Bradyrhizobium sp. AUGA SZCCT0431]